MLYVFRNDKDAQIGIAFKKSDEWVSAWLPQREAYALGCQLMVSALASVEELGGTPEPFTLIVSGFANIEREYAGASPLDAARLYIHETGANLDAIVIRVKA